MYNIAFTDVKDQAVKVFDNSAGNPIIKDGTGWKYTYQADDKARSNNQSQAFNNQFSYGNYGFETERDGAQGGFGSQNSGFQGLGNGFGLDNQSSFSQT